MCNKWGHEVSFIVQSKKNPHLKIKVQQVFFCFFTTSVKSLCLSHSNHTIYANDDTKSLNHPIVKISHLHYDVLNMWEVSGPLLSPSVLLWRRKKHQYFHNSEQHERIQVKRALHCIIMLTRCCILSGYLDLSSQKKSHKKGLCYRPF